MFLSILVRQHTSHQNMSLSPHPFEHMHSHWSLITSTVSSAWSYSQLAKSKHNSRMYVGFLLCWDFLFSSDPPPALRHLTLGKLGKHRPQRHAGRISNHARWCGGECCAMKNNKNHMEVAGQTCHVSERGWKAFFVVIICVFIIDMSHRE